MVSIEGYEENKTGRCDENVNGWSWEKVGWGSAGLWNLDFMQVGRSFGQRKDIIWSVFSKIALHAVWSSILAL